MNVLVKWIALGLLLVIVYSCGSNLDISGRGARRECFYLSTDSLKIRYTCDERAIYSIDVYLVGLPGETKKQLLFRTTFNEPVKEYLLPVDRKKIDSSSVEIELHITDTHWRETFYIRIDPGDLNEKREVYSRYFGH